MKSLVLLRHAKSSWKNPDMDDFDRTLNDRGTYDAPRMAELMQAEKLKVDLILCSSAVRTRQTLALILLNYPFDGDVYFSKELYHSSKETIQSHLAKFAGKKKHVMIVGHNPGLEDFLSALIDSHIEMPTCALAHLAKADGSDFELSSGGRNSLKLLNFWKPKEI